MNDRLSIKLLTVALGVSFILMAYFLLKISFLEGSLTNPLPSLPPVANFSSLWIIFLTGLTVGGLTCLAVQGGLLASTIAAREEENVKMGGNHQTGLWPVASFLVAKLVVYSLLGLLLGLFGQTLALSDTVRIAVQLIAGVYMVAIALNLLEIHPIFRYMVIQPPKFLTRVVRNQSKSKDLFAPGILGAMTIFIPCGTTLAMEALAISSGSPLLGALIMSAFVLGTTPLFLGLGFLTTILGNNFQGRLLKFAALAVLYLGIISVNGALVAGGSPISLPSIQIGPTGSRYQAQAAPGGSEVTQNPQIDISPSGYTPNYIRVKKGKTVNLTLKSRGAAGCALAFRIPSLGIAKNLAPNDSQLISFVPTKSGQIQFNCSMGMYRGVIEVL